MSDDFDIKILMGLFAIALAVEGFAQMPVLGLTKQLPAQTAPKKIEDPLGRTTPHDTVVNFIRSCGRRDFAQAGEFLDTGDQGERRQQLARMLMHMMNAGLKVNLDLLSENPEGTLDDGLPLTREKVGEVKIDNDSLEILLDRVQRRDNPPT